MKILHYVWIVFVTISLYATEKKIYKFSHDPVDVVFVCHEKDIDSLLLAIEGVYKNIDHRTIYVVSERKFTDQAQWVDERIFPFTKKMIAQEVFGNEKEALEYLAHEKNRTGWLYQQLCKMYALFIIPDISENVLVVDADTIFLNKVWFMDRSGAPLFNVGKEYHVPYFEHMHRLIPWLKKVYADKSGITHHMLFQKCIMQDFFNEVAIIHGKEPWRAMCQLVDKKHLFRSAFSEYELYFNFAMSKTNQAKIRPLSWCNHMRADAINLSVLKRDYDYVSWHKYIN